MELFYLLVIYFTKPQSCDLFAYRLQTVHRVEVVAHHSRKVGSNEYICFITMERTSAARYFGR